MAIDTLDNKVASAGRKTEEIIISADSHVMEAVDLRKSRVPAEFREEAPVYKRNPTGSLPEHPGGHDPNARIREMETDGVSAEVLYPTLGLKLFGLDDARLQEACFRVYNDWLIEYCQLAPERLLGVSCSAVYEIDQA